MSVKNLQMTSLSIVAYLLVIGLLSPKIVGDEVPEFLQASHSVCFKVWHSPQQFSRTPFNNFVERFSVFLQNISQYFFSVPMCTFMENLLQKKHLCSSQIYSIFLKWNFSTLELTQHRKSNSCHEVQIGFFHLTLLWRRSISCKNQSIDLLCKSIDWFLYNRNLIMKQLNEKTQLICTSWHELDFRCYTNLKVGKFHFKKILYSRNRHGLLCNTHVRYWI